VTTNVVFINAETLFYLKCSSPFCTDCCESLTFGTDCFQCLLSVYRM